MSDWPIVWKVDSNVETTMHSNSGTSYTYKTIPEHIDLTVKGTMLDGMSVTLKAIPDPDFKVFHFPGIETATAEPSGPDGGGGGSTTTVAPYPPKPTGISISIVESSSDAGEMVSVSGDTISIGVGDARQLFPFDRMKYTKDWKDKEMTDFFPWDVSDDDYDSIAAIQPSSTGLWTGYILVQVNSSSSLNPTIRISITIENDYSYWVSEFIEPMMAKSREFVMNLEEDTEIDDGRSESPVLKPDEGDYVPVTPELFNEDKDGNRKGTNLNDTIKEDGDKSDLIRTVDDIISTTKEGDVLIPKLTRHKEDLLSQATDLLGKGEYQKPNQLIKDVERYITNDIDNKDRFIKIRDAIINRNIGFVNTESGKIVQEDSISPNKIQTISVYLEELSNSNFDRAVEVVNTIITNIENNAHHLPEIELINTKMESGDTETSQEYLDELLNGEQEVFDNIPNPTVSNIEVDAKSYVNPKKHSKEQLQKWLDDNLRRS